MQQEPGEGGGAGLSGPWTRNRTQVREGRLHQDGTTPLRCGFQDSGPVLVCSGPHNKVPQTGRQKCISSQSGSRKSEIRRQEGWFLPGLSPWLGDGHLLLLASHHLLSVSYSPPLTRTRSYWMRAHPNDLVLIISLRTLSANTATFGRTRGQDFNT